MSTLAGLLHHQSATGQVLANHTPTPMASSTSGSNGTNGSSSSDDSATISANDFLTLLVTEMQNQDPTADTDPNEYINQLVNVNSLEQLIDINQTLSTDAGSAPGSTGTGASGQVSTNAPGALAAAPSSAAAHLAGSPLPAMTGATAPASQIAGNLSVPPGSPAAERVGHALTARTRLAAAGGIPLANQ